MEVKPEVLSHPEQFSLIYSAHPFIVPGGRFLEFYYWDSYCVMEGLLLSEMPGTVKGMLQNFLDLVRIYGHVPNGARVYYLQRSQPPLLTLMMDSYLTHTDDTAFLRDNIGTLALELDFWTENRTISVSLGGKSYPESLCCPSWGTQAAYQPQEGCRGNCPNVLGTQWLHPYSLGPSLGQERPQRTKTAGKAPPGLWAGACREGLCGRALSWQEERGSWQSEDTEEDGRAGRPRGRLCFFTAWPPACTAAPPCPPKPCLLEFSSRPLDFSSACMQMIPGVSEVTVGWKLTCPVAGVLVRFLFMTR
ncbi:uncharacterized protein LOC117803322 isoform X2 [Ailuropoda melanoleuca]|uniref:uncharacterized protein LOC117803322 isoform X2 n=1 Tax=Ailuropoda melanoleuca TaxID=9646 RepID=UPI0014945C65|nr:uncharacterized protein LOC117803322 isoform X2 [Ailuropoda melanoleuca]